MGTISKGSLSWSTVKSRLTSENGTHEYPAGSNKQKFGVWYGWNGVPWCVMYESWAFRGSTQQMGGKCAGVWSLADRFKKQGRYGRTPKVGALFCLDDYKHTGVVLAVYDTYVATIEGNTGRQDGSNPWRGQVAYRKRRRSTITGYCYPIYSGTTSTSTSGQRLLDVDGYWGPNSTKAMQEFLNREYKTGLSVDGSFGPKTANGVLKWIGRTQDGALSSSDIKAVEAKVGTSQSGTWNRANGYDATSKAIQSWLNKHRT